MSGLLVQFSGFSLVRLFGGLAMALGAASVLIGFLGIPRTSRAPAHS